MFALVMEPNAMIQLSVLTQPHRTAVANFVQGDFGHFRRNPYQPLAEPWGSTNLVWKALLYIRHCSWPTLIQHFMRKKQLIMWILQVALGDGSTGRVGWKTTCAELITSLRKTNWMFWSVSLTLPYECASYQEVIHCLEKIFVKPVNKVYAWHKLNTCCRKEKRRLKNSSNV